MSNRPDDLILEHYEQALVQHGDTPEGAMWPNEQDRTTRYDVMLDLLAEPQAERVVLCDLGCGTGELLTRIRERGLHHISYVGVDRSARALEMARAKFPGVPFIELDVNDAGADLTAIDCDYLVANGLFTVKHLMTQDQMAYFLESTIRAVWPRVRRGIAFNVMSKVVDWERDDLFHASMDDMARLLHTLAGRRVRMRADYGLYEFTCYAYHPDPDPGPERESVVADPILPPGERELLRVLRPSLPIADRILPYLRRIDSTRIYSNFGPLVLEFEARMGGLLGLQAGGLVSASTGTSGLVGAILASAGRATRDRPLALMPAYTFVATAVAAQECGYQPFLADIDGKDWLLDPCALLKHPRLNEIGVVVPVATYGRPVPQAAWLDFRDRTGIAVVIDGAASFEAVAAARESFIGPIPVVFSLHATKSIGTGEGGCVATNDIGLATSIGQRLNFGFHFTRECQVASTNGKMSEYHAAVGLAELDRWTEKQSAFARVLANYRESASIAGLSRQLMTAPGLCSSYVLFHCDSLPQSMRVQDFLRNHRIEFRLWYGMGLQQQPYFANCPADPLPVTHALAPRLLGLPMAPDLCESSIHRVVQALAEGLSPMARLGTP